MRSLVALALLAVASLACSHTAPKTAPVQPFSVVGYVSMLSWVPAHSEPRARPDGGINIAEIPDTYHVAVSLDTGGLQFKVQAAAFAALWQGERVRLTGVVTDEPHPVLMVLTIAYESDTAPRDRSGSQQI